MPALVVYGSVILLFLILASGGILILRASFKKKELEYQNQIKKLEQDLGNVRTDLTSETEKVKGIQGTTDYEKYAGLVIAQMDRAVIFIDHQGIVKLINNYAQQYLDLAATVGKSYKEVIHIRETGGAENYALFESAFSGNMQQLPENIELVSQHGTIPINGAIYPLMKGKTVGALVFMFENYSKQSERIKEEQAFFSAAAHELRTPLTIIRMTVSLLKDKFETLSKDKIIEHLRRTDETTDRLVRLVNDFLNISRIDQGRLEITLEKFDMITLTDDVIHDLGLLIKERKLYVHHESNIPERFVKGDKAKAHEVMANLISNGLKYTIQGGLTITHAVSDSHMVTTVSDTGPGIPREQQSLLFKRFGQVGVARQQQATKSTGLGLYISKKVAQLMHGDVQLEKSEPGTGSVFTFSLPLG